MAAIIGTGLDELMRHNPSLKTVCLKAIVQTMNKLVSIGKSLIAEEDGLGTRVAAGKYEEKIKYLDTSRTLLMQYGYNIVQLLEQILHSEDHITPFVSAGGFDALLDMARWTVTPGGRALVANVTCLSSPSVSLATHSSTSRTLSILVRSVCR